MALNDLPDFDASTPGNNIDVGGVNCNEGCLPGNLNDCIRGFASIVKRAVGNKGSDIASAATCNIAAASTSIYAVITGTTAITSFGTVAAGTRRIVEFASALTLTHNSTSLKLPGSANIATAAGDIAFMISLGSGNWKCLHYSRADGSPIALGSTATATSTDAGATQGPDIIADRNSASPAASDIIGAFILRGRDSAGNSTDYAKLKGKILDATNGSEDGAAILSALVAGSDTAIITAGPGVQIGSPTGGDPGAGKVNAAGYQINGAAIGNIVLQRFYNSLTGPQGSLASNIIPSDTSTPGSTEGTQVFAQAVTPKSATSKIVLRGTVCFGVNTASVQPVLALFSGTTCLAVFPDDNDSSANNSITFEYEEASGSTSARTYSVRFGTDSGTSIINGDGGSGGSYGSKIVSSMTIEEVL
jgi:hypothetical protein